MDERRNFYRLLNVQPDAPTAVIQASYRALMQKCKLHPDLGGDNELAGLLNQAYQTLKDPVKRAAYDQMLTEAERNPWAASPTQQQCIFCSQPVCMASQSFCPNCAIPLTPVHKINTGPPDGKRALPRLPHGGEIHYTQHPMSPYRKAICLDLTPTGMGCLVPENLACDTLIKLEAPVLVACSRVAHCSPNSNPNPAIAFRIGVEFITVSFKQGKSQFVDRSV